MGFDTIERLGIFRWSIRSENCILDASTIFDKMLEKQVDGDLERKYDDCSWENLVIWEHLLKGEYLIMNIITIMNEEKGSYWF